jgi:glyoxylase-like metal-dependent hydrolase (beta-lactamase superfamily II)
MIQIETLTYNSFQVNTYLVWDETGDCMVVDPAFHSTEETASFDNVLSGRGLLLKGQVNTHGHVDHLLGVRHIREKYGLTFRAHDQEEKNVKRAPLMGEVFGLKLDPVESIEASIQDGELISIGNHQLRALLVPGHSPGSLAFYSEEGGFVITGDALFHGSIGRTDLPGGDYDQLIQSIRSRLLTLPPETIVYPGHGPSSTIGEEKAGNPFLHD